MTAFGLEQKTVESVLLTPETKVTTTVRAGVTFKTFTLGKNEFVSVTSQMSLVNAAMTVQRLVDWFEVDGILFAGIAGGLDEHIKPGDVTICEKWAYYMEGAMLNEKPDGGYFMPVYLKSRYPNYGPLFPEDVFVIRSGMKESKQKSYFEADARMLRVARKVVDAAQLEKVDGRAPKVRIGGNGVAGPLFMDNAKLREFVRKLRDAHTLDMESTALGQAAWCNQKPFLVVRGISDLAGGQTGVNTEELHGPLAAKNAAIVLKQVLLGL
jgi:adenosylhomocysteine nucleosidase